MLPVVAIVLFVAVASILVLNRRLVLIPFLLPVFMIPFGQVIVIAGSHFTLFRLLVLAGLLRLAVSRPSPPGGILAGGVNGIDKVFFLWAASYTFAFIFLYMQWAAVVNRLGFLVDALGGYIVLRFLIRDETDRRLVIRLLVFISVVMAISMAAEQTARYNVFGLLGGIRTVPEVRGGLPRSQGVFQHPLLAGAFGATALPLFVALWREKSCKLAALFGIVAASVITWTAASSTPWSAYVAGIAGLCLWPFRNRMRTIRWGLLIVLIGLHLFMKAPVWALIGRVDLTGSSSSYHRYLLVDNLIRHVGDWYLLGVKEYGDWGFDMWDTSNEYVNYGLKGGLATLVFFIAIISRSFGSLGKARKSSGDRRRQWLLWCLGAALFAHVVTYFGVDYFDQTQVAWYTLLAIICSASSASPYREERPVHRRGYLLSIEPVIADSPIHILSAR